RQFGKGPNYVVPASVPRSVQRYQNDRDEYLRACKFTRRCAGKAYSAALHRSRLHRAIGKPSVCPLPGGRPLKARQPDRRVLFVSSNGVGVGHLTRLLAIARRMPAGIAPVFATMSQAMKVI